MSKENRSVPGQEKPSMIEVEGIKMAWDVRKGTVTFENLPVVMMAVDTTLTGLMSGVQAMVGSERFWLALQNEGRKSVDADWRVISKFSDFSDGFKAIADRAAVAGWGEWTLASIDAGNRRCCFRVKDGWEGRYQKTSGVCWGSGMLAGKFAGYCSRLFGTNCWADQTKFIAKGDPYDEFVVEPSGRTVEDEIEKLLLSDRATCEDMAVSFKKLQSEIKERKQTEERLKKSEAKYRFLAEHMHDVVWTVDLDMRTRYVSPSIEEALGFTPKERMNMLASEQLTPESFERAQKMLAESFQNDKDPGVDPDRTVTMELNFYRKDGSVACLESAMSFIRDENSIPTGVYGLSRDITERKRAEELLRASEEQYRLITESSLTGIYIHQDGLFQYVNSPLADMLGYSPDEMIGKRFWEFIDSEDQERIKAFSSRRLEGKPIPMQYELRGLTKSGETRWFEVRANIINYGGRPAVMGNVVDITERRRVEAERLLLTTAIEQAAEMVIITDKDGLIQYVNPAFEATTGYSAKEIVGKHPNILKGGMHGDDYYRDVSRKLTRGEVWRGNFINKKKDGTIYEEASTVSPVKDETGRIVNYVAVTRDVTRELMLQKQLLQAQKMEAVGTLAGGIAHDFNNLLQAILGYSDLLLTKKGQQDPDRKKLEAIMRAARDGADLVSRILAFGRKGDSKFRPTDLNHEIRRVEKLLHRSLPRMIRIDLALSEDLRVIDADPAQIEQVLLNLGVNAKHAMPDGGQFLIETQNVSLSDEYVSVHLGAKPGKYVLLTVSDTGVGMQPDVLDRVFEPFFTTKTDGEGTGLGLSMVHGIVSQHGGYIRCYSEPGRGTSFKIYFPVSACELIPALAVTREMPAFGTETILLVDDDDRIRDVGRQLIEMGGYQVIGAKSGEEALEIYAAHRKEISLIILDLIMPGMGGTRCLQELLRVDPDVRVLLASGYSANGTTVEENRTGARGFIRKPYDAKDILAAIRRVLDKGCL
jgi:two-component system cell cycle sensor histidine kinase/response regulator CckA